MSLADSLSNQAAAVAAMAPAPVLDILNESVHALTATGITDRSVAVGDQAPAFALPDATGATVSLQTF
jgi:hypothetical protein